MPGERNWSGLEERWVRGVGEGWRREEGERGREHMLTSRDRPY